MNKLQRPPPPLKPLMQDRLRRLPNTSVLGDIGLSEEDEEADGRGGTPAERRVRFLENAIKFLRQQHEELLSALHHEVDSLKRTNQSTTYYVLLLAY